MAVKKNEGKREQILRAAEKVFAEKGFQEATVSDIVGRAKVSEATLYEYYASKEELLFSIPGDLTSNQKEEIEFILDHVRGASNKIRAFIYHNLWFWQTRPDYAAVALVILKQNRKFINTESYRIIFDTYQMMLPVIEEGIASGEFREGTNPKLVLSMMLSIIEYITVNKILHGTPEDLLEYVDPITDQLLGGIMNQQA
ncbi:MAG TPA: TetR/AcrR family transcriptional regulator [Spirochaetota bacterium]|nr:TetR/AcrR family transcriptional regulator [Spirochaetota bacterium]HPJ36102.1 TetR/AcrR family transcriptional regulator [Spirochaetota bacterium]